MAQSTDVLVAMFHAVDDLDWDRFRDCLAPIVDMDYTSLWGGQPERTAVDDLIASWRAMAPGFDATQHLLGPIAPLDDTARALSVTTNVRAYHHLAGETWLVAGRYDVSLARSRDRTVVAAITLRVLYEEGSRRLVDLARARVEAGAGRPRR